MSEALPQPRSPTILAFSSGANWEQSASVIAREAGIQWRSLPSVNDFFMVEGDDLHDTCLVIDAQHPNLQWDRLHEGMLEKRIEIPVVVVVPEDGRLECAESVARCANFIVSHPIDRNVLQEMVDFAFHNERFVRHRFAVERSYQRLSTLNERERSILSMAVEGAPNKQIARKLGVHIKTVERIRNVAYGKLGVRSTAEMTRLMTLAELYEFMRPNPQPRANGKMSLHTHAASTTPGQGPKFDKIKQGTRVG